MNKIYVIGYYEGYNSEDFSVCYITTLKAKAYQILKKYVNNNSKIFKDYICKEYEVGKEINNKHNSYSLCSFE